MKAVKQKVTRDFDGSIESDKIVHVGTLQECSDYLRDRAIEILSSSSPHLYNIVISKSEFCHYVDDGNIFLHEYKIVDYD